jgi:hypothetical protein
VTDQWVGDSQGRAVDVVDGAAEGDQGDRIALDALDPPGGSWDGYDRAPFGVCWDGLPESLGGAAVDGHSFPGTLAALRLRTCRPPPRGSLRFPLMTSG